jgi:hypothetical protein
MSKRKTAKKAEKIDNNSQPPYVITLKRLLDVEWEEIDCKYALERDGELAIINSKGEVCVY